MTEDTIKIQRLAAEVAVLRTTLATLIAWSMRELGEAGVRQLLAMLEPHTPRPDGITQDSHGPETALKP